MDHANTIRDPEFFLGGKAIFTVDNGKPTPQHRRYTYRIVRKEFSSGESYLFVYYLTGPDNARWSSYTYLGKLNTNRMEVVPTTRSKLGEDSPPFRAVNWAIATVLSGNPPPGNALILHEGRCACCGRRLTTPESIRAGFGPKCSAVLAGSRT